MKRPPRILVGVDLGDESAEATRQAAAWAELHGWDLIACNVALPPIDLLFPQRTADEVIAPMEIERERLQSLREHVAKITRGAPTRVRVLFATGDAGAEIVRAAEREAAGIVVVGSPHRAGLAHGLLAGVAEYVVQHASCSVLVARPHRRTGHVLVGTDLSPEALAAVALAAEHARRLGARLTVACSIERRMEPLRNMTNFGGTYEFLEDESEDLRAEAERQLDEQLRAVGSRGEKVILDGPPAKAIVHAVEQGDFDLLVVGAASANGVKRLQLGRVADQVVRAAPCPVLVTRQ